MDEIDVYWSIQDCPGNENEARATDEQATPQGLFSLETMQSTIATVYMLRTIRYGEVDT